MLFAWVTVVNRGYYAWTPPRKPKRPVRMKTAAKLALNANFLRDETKETRRRRGLSKVREAVVEGARKVKPLVKKQARHAARVCIGKISVPPLALLYFHDQVS